MNRLQKILTVSTFPLTLIAACDSNFNDQRTEENNLPSNYVEGRVIEEFGNVIAFLKPGNDPKNIFIDPSKVTYGVKVETFQGVYTIQFDDTIGSPGPKTNFNFAMAIEEGTILRFPTENVPYNGKTGKWVNLPGFSKDRIGYIDPDDVEIIKRY